MILFRIKNLLTFFFLLAGLLLSAQEDSIIVAHPDSTDFVAPLDIPLKLSGNFGEIRSNHFHTGIDIKTGGVEGKNIIAVDSGFISRINVSPYGYGKAIYIDHPNGYTSVYGHMSKFTDKVEAFIAEKQYEEETFKIEFYPDSNEFVVKKGELIGLSGNTGHSGGPHLHFELRKTVSEHPMNPLLFDFEVKDDVKPILKGIRLYPKDALSRIADRNKARSYPLRPDSKGKYKVVNDTIEVNGNIGLGVFTLDKMTGVSNNFSVYSLMILVDQDTIYAHYMNELDFETNRYSNCQIDYALLKKNKWKYHKCFPAENNLLEIYDKKGSYLTFNEGDVKRITVMASDIDSNLVNFSFMMKGIPVKSADKDGPTFNQWFDASTDNVFENSEISVLVPKGRLYDDLAFNFKEEPLSLGAKSKTYTLGDKLVPLQDVIFITIKVAEEDKNNEKIRLYKFGKKDKLRLQEGIVKDNVFEGSTKEFGKFILKEDVTPPVITVRAFPTGISSNNSVVSFAFSDDLSGVKEITAKVDGKWLMVEHNASHSYGFCNFEDFDLAEGEHSFSIEVKDACGNVTTVDKTFNWR